jgi:hypothetical protein
LALRGNALGEGMMLVEQLDGFDNGVGVGPWTLKSLTFERDVVESGLLFEVGLSEKYVNRVRFVHRRLLANGWRLTFVHDVIVGNFVPRSAGTR